MKARENPFSTDKLDNLKYKLNDCSWDQIISKLQGLNYRAAVVGPHGSGKTCFLTTLGSELDKRGVKSRYINFSDKPYRYWIRREGDDEQVILLDGIEANKYWKWFVYKHLCRGPLVVSSHETISLPTLYQCRTTVGLMQEVLKEVVPNLASELRLEAERAYHKNSGNIREVFLELYDWGGVRRVE